MTDKKLTDDERRILRLRRLVSYAKHFLGCPASFTPYNICTCGLHKLLEEIEEDQ